MKYAIPALACLFLLVFSCRTTPLEEVENIDPQVDGQSIFKTIFFSVGDAAEKIPSFKENVKLLHKMSDEDPNFMKNYVSSIDDYIAQIERTNPDYFDQLEKAVYAPDFLEIKKAVEFGNLLLVPAIIQSNLDKVRDENLKRELEEVLSTEPIDFQNKEKLKKLSSGLLNVISEYDSERQSADENNGRALVYDYDYNYNLNYDLNYNYNYNLSYNYIYNYNWSYHFNLNWSLNYNYNYNLNYSYNYNLNFSYIYNIAIPADVEDQNYDNYTGEELIREIAAGFNQ